MAATDKHYRDQNSLDVVFALSSIAMFVGLVLMLVQDYNREYKQEQRVFRDVEVADVTDQIEGALAARGLLQLEVLAEDAADPEPDQRMAVDDEAGWAFARHCFRSFVCGSGRRLGPRAPFASILAQPGRVR